jgi:hypothetical protein
MASGVLQLVLPNRTCLTMTISRFWMLKARFRIPQQKPLGGEAFALLQTWAIETNGSRIELKENVFHGVGSRNLCTNYQNALDF